MTEIRINPLLVGIIIVGGAAAAAAWQAPEIKRYLKVRAM
jgi:hypothetical protein